jgi:hypothetical protein
MQEFTPDCQALGKGAPFTGSAIYVSTDAAWHEGAWPLWTHIVRYVDGCLGCAGGKVIESVDGHENSYIVYVGWESIEKHEVFLKCAIVHCHWLIANRPTTIPTISQPGELCWGWGIKVIASMGI